MKDPIHDLPRKSKHYLEILIFKVLKGVIKVANIVFSVATGDYSDVTLQSFNTEADVAASYTSKKVQSVKGNWNIIAPRKK